MRTMVAPSAMASSKSWLIPMLRCRRPAPPILCQRISSKISRVREKPGGLWPRVIERGHRHQPDELQIGHRIDLLGQMHCRPDRNAKFAAAPRWR